MKKVLQNPRVYIIIYILVGAGFFYLFSSTAQAQYLNPQPPQSMWPTCPIYGGDGTCNMGPEGGCNGTTGYPQSYISCPVCDSYQGYTNGCLLPNNSWCQDGSGAHLICPISGGGCNCNYSPPPSGPTCTDIYDLCYGQSSCCGGGPVCGNGYTESGEQCDDGNRTNGDGCSSSCTWECSSPKLTSSLTYGVNSYAGQTVEYHLSMTNSGAPINGTITATANCPVGATCTFYKWIGGVGFGAAGNPAYLTLQDFQQGPSYSAYYAVTPGVNTPKDVYTIDIKASFTPAAGCFTNNAATRVYLNTDFGTRDAQCSSVNAPDRVSPGQSFSATITMLNTGAASWINRDLGSGIYDLYRLGGFNPANGAIDVTIWGVGRWGANSYPITAGTIGTFSGNFTAPAAIATYPFYWKMVNDKSYPNMGGGAWFGGYCGKNITVQPVPAPTVTLSVNTAFGSVSNGGSIYTHGYNDVPTLTWSSTDTTSCTLTSNNGDSKTGTSDTNVAANGLGNDSGSGRTITYTLNCAGPSGNASASANVLIPPAPTAPNAVCPSPGTAATLSWTAPAGYTNFYVRNDDVTSGMPANSHAYWNENFAGTRYDIPNAYPGYAYPVNPIPNHNYSMWIHSRAPNGAYSMAAGVNYTCQPLVSPGSASASLTGTNTCNKMALSWSGFTGTIAGYRLYRSTDGSLGSLIKDIASTASSGSYTDSNVPANTYYYSIKAYNAGGESAAVAMAGNPKGIIDCQATASSEKDIVAVNSTPLPNWPYGYLSGGTDTLPAPIASSLKVGDTLSFSITLRSQGDMAVKNIRITDYLINLQMATSTGWNAKYNGAALIYDGAQPAGSTSCTPASSGHYCAFGTAPNQTLVFNLTGASYDIPAPVAPATEVDRSLTFDAQLAVPSGYGGSAPRFQNAYSASYDKTAGSQTTTTGSTPLILFSTGKKGPSIIEIP